MPTPNPTAKNHYLPQGYQRFFADPSDPKKRQPWVGEVANGRWKQVRKSTSSVGFVRHLYDPIVEKSFQVVEDHAYPAIAASIQGHELGELELGFLASFIFTLRFRGPDAVMLGHDRVRQHLGPRAPDRLVRELVQLSLLERFRSERILELGNLNRRIFKFEAASGSGVWTTDRPVLINALKLPGPPSGTKLRVVSMALDPRTVIVFHDGSVLKKQLQDYAEGHNQHLLTKKPKYIFTHREIQEGTYLKDVGVLKLALTDKVTDADYGTHPHK